MPPILLSARELAQRLDVSYETILSWTHRGKIPTIRDGRNRLIFNLDTVLKSLRAGVPADPEGRKPIRPKRRVSDTSGQTNPIDVPAPDLITEDDVREVLEPQVVDEPIDHQRHFYAPDGTRVWDRAECQDPYRAIAAAKEVRS